MGERAIRDGPEPASRDETSQAWRVIDGATAFTWFTQQGVEGHDHAELTIGLAGQLTQEFKEAFVRDATELFDSVSATLPCSETVWRLYAKSCGCVQHSILYLRSCFC